MITDARRCSSITAALICSAVTTLMTRISLLGGGRDVIPVIRTTSAPLLLAILAMAYPIFPEERLVMHRTGSMDSMVGPAVTRTLSIEVILLRKDVLHLFHDIFDGGQPALSLPPAREVARWPAP